MGSCTGISRLVKTYFVSRFPTLRKYNFENISYKQRSASILNNHPVESSRTFALIKSVYTKREAILVIWKWEVGLLYHKFRVLEHAGFTKDRIGPKEMERGQCYWKMGKQCEFKVLYNGFQDYHSQLSNVQLFAILSKDSLLYSSFSSMSVSVFRGSVCEISRSFPYIFN